VQRTRATRGSIYGMRIKLALGILATGLAVAACGGDSGSTTAAGSSSAGGQSAQPGGAAVVVSVTQTSIGKVLTGPDGRTLYTLLSSAGTPLPCTGGCATAWPPLTAQSGATAGSGVTATIAVDSGGQVTAGGVPLYYFAGDASPGQTSGQGVRSFGGIWYAVNAAGKPVTASTGGGAGSTPTYSGY
jgi:predicted lipoprotein with Yx(FWY)xxD motif